MEEMISRETLMVLFLAHPNTPLPDHGRGVRDNMTTDPFRFTTTLTGRFIFWVSFGCEQCIHVDVRDLPPHCVELQEPSPIVN